MPKLFFLKDSTDKADKCRKHEENVFQLFCGLRHGLSIESKVSPDIAWWLFKNVEVVTRTILTEMLKFVLSHGWKTSYFFSLETVILQFFLHENLK